MPLPVTEYRPQLTKSPRLLWWLIVAGGALLFLMLILAAPLAAAGHYDRFALAIYRSFSTFCHQLPERSYFIAGHKFAVCARCTGLYAGFALTTLAYPLFRSLRVTLAPPRKWLMLAAIPMALDFSLTLFGVWENTHSSRFLTGLLLGSVAVFYVMPGVADLSMRGWRSRATPSSGRFTLVSAEAIAAAPSDYSAPDRRI